MEIDQVVCRPSADYPRHSEGDVIELADGRLLLAWTAFYGGFSDHAAAHIASLQSSDGGQTWGSPSVLQGNVGECNVMSVSLLRLRAGPLLFFFLVKNAVSDCQVWMRRSDDEAATWAAPRRVSCRPGYHVMNNARVIQLTSGRLLAPVALTADAEKGPSSRAFCYLSDDAGATWRPGRGDTGVVGSPAQEPGLAELGDGVVLMIIRTRLGHIYLARSQDGGETWTDAKPSVAVSPAAPATIARIPDRSDFLLIWNNNMVGAKARWSDRTPLTSAVSYDAGASWAGVKDIEPSPTWCHAYTSVTFVGADALLTYYAWDRMAGNRPFENTALKFRRIPIDWFET